MKSPPLYDEELLERVRHPVGQGELAPPRVTGHASNPLCGDDVAVDVRLRDGRIDSLAHRARGCALTVASASLLAETLGGTPANEARALARALDAALRDGGPLPAALAVLETARAFPSRRRCVVVSWEALVQALALAEAWSARA